MVLRTLDTMEMTLLQSSTLISCLFVGGTLSKGILLVEEGGVDATALESIRSRSKPFGAL